jgi:hypothetical protein
VLALNAENENAAPPGELFERFGTDLGISRQKLHERPLLPSVALAVILSSIAKSND